MNAQTERLSLLGAAGVIEAVRDTAATAPGVAPRGVAVIAHPHPLLGGTQDNKVVQTLARALVQCGWTAVRFNLRGVGASAGTHDEGRGELEDFLAVVEQVAPSGALALAGFKVPRMVIFGDIPKTATGKIQKFELRKQAGSASAIVPK